MRVPSVLPGHILTSSQLQTRAFSLKPSVTQLEDFSHFQGPISFSSFCIFKFKFEKEQICVCTLFLGCLVFRCIYRHQASTRFSLSRDDNGFHPLTFPGQHCSLWSQTGLFLSSLGILVFPPLMLPFPVSSSWFQDYSCAHTEDHSLDFEISATLVNFKRLYQCFVLHLIISNKELVSSGLLLIYIFIDVWLNYFWKLGLYFVNHLAKFKYIIYNIFVPFDFFSGVFYKFTLLSFLLTLKK